MSCCPPGKAGTARELPQLGQLQEEPGFFCGTDLCPLGTAPGMSVTPKTPQSSVYLHQLLLGDVAQQHAAKRNGFTCLSQVRELGRPGRAPD